MNVDLASIFISMQSVHVLQRRQRYSIRHSPLLTTVPAVIYSMAMDLRRTQHIIVKYSNRWYSTHGITEVVYRSYLIFLQF